MNKVNNKPFFIKKQAFNKDFSRLDPLLVKKLPEEVATWVPVKLAIANYLIELDRLYNGRVFPSQIEMAKKFGICRVYCSKLVSEIRKSGLIMSSQRYNNSCVYSINPVIFLAPMIDKLSHHLKALRSLYLMAMIFNPFTLHSQTYATILKKGKDIRKESYIEAPSDGEDSMSEKRVSVADRGPVADIIKNLPFELDTEQKVFLCAFPYDALVYAQEKLELASKLDNPWRFFIVKCLDYCNEEKIKPDWEWVDYLRSQYGMLNDPNLKSAPYKPKQQEEPQRETTDHSSPLKPVEVTQDIKRVTECRPSIKKQIEAMPKKQIPYSSYSVFTGQRPETIENRMLKLRKEISAGEAAVEKARASDNPFLMIAREKLEFDLAQNKRDLMDLEQNFFVSRL